MEYRVLGPLTVAADGGLAKLGGPRQRLVLAVLLSHANHTVSQDALIESVWSGNPPDAAKATLHSYVYNLRRELGGNEIARQGDGYRVEVTEDSFDALRFESLVNRGRKSLGNDPATAGETLREALELWYGTPYGDLDTNPTLAVEVARLQELRLAAVEGRIDAELATGDHSAVVGELETLVRQHPLRERFRAQQMLALYRCGRQAEALRAYQHARSHLGEELGIDPSSELQELEQRILDHDPELAAGVDAKEGDSSGGSDQQLLRGFEMREPLGEGDFGVVYRAYQPSVGREVAVKVIRPEYANQPTFVRRFEQEAQLIAQLEHPHIVPLFDYWRDPGGAYLVMPLYRGGSLTTALARGGWNVTPALRLIEQVGGALAFAHRHGVIHGDVKPGNVLLDEEDNAYLADFGIATRATDGAEAPLTTSAAFVPPEGIRGEPSTAASDLFSLGVLIFHLLTGVVPRGRLPLPSLTEARPGLPAALDAVVARATADRPDDRFDRVDDLLRAFRQALGADTIEVSTNAQLLSPGELIRNPYKGLRPFLEGDHLDFFGRDALIGDLLHAVSTHNLIAVVGPSGSGKSSLVRAGLIPALRAGGVSGSRQWVTTDMFPGSFPFEELEASLLRVAVDWPSGLLDELLDAHGLLRVTKRILPGDDTTLVLVIDQFEELFSAVVSEATRRLFLANLVSVATDERSRVRVVLTMRADFFDRPLEYSEFAEILGLGLVTVGPPTRDGLAQAIAAPARGVGVELEPGLASRIIADVENQPGGLPLLQYALTELFAIREGQTLTVDGYEQTGGVLGALGRRAEELYGETSEAGQEAIRQLFLRLVTVDENGADTRRRARQSELQSLDVDQQALEVALGHYGAFRLISFDRDPVTRGPTVEVAHEALLREWDRLAAWIDDRREDLILHHRVNAVAQEWAESGRDPSFLLRGARLEQAEQWRQTTDIALADLEVEYLAVSAEQRDLEQERSRRRRRRLVLALSVGLLVVATLAAVAYVQRQEAEREAREAAARELASEAILALPEDPERSVLLVLEAVESLREAGEPLLPEVVGTLQRAVQKTRLEMRLGGGDSAVAVDPNGSWFVTDEGHMLTNALVWDVSGNVRTTLVGPGAPVVRAAASPRGRRVAVSYDTRERPDDAAVMVFDPDTGDEVARFDGPPAYYWDVRFSPDGTLVAAGRADPLAQPGTRWVTVWNLATGAEALSFQPSPQATSIEFLPGGELMVAEGHANGWRLGFHEPTTGELTRSIDLPDMEVPLIAINPSGTHVAVGSVETRRLHVLDVATGRRVLDIPIRDAKALDWSPDGRLLAYSGNQGVISLVDVASGEVEMELAGNATTSDLAFLPDGERLLSVSLGRTTLWDVSPDGPEELGALLTHTGPQWGFQVSSDGSQLATYTDPPGGFELLDTENGEIVAALSDEMVGVDLGVRSVSPDFSLMGSLHRPSGRSTIRSLPTLEEVAELEACTNPLAFSPDNSLVLVSGHVCQGEVPTGAAVTSSVVEIATGKTVLEIPYQWINSAVFNPEGALAGGRYLAATDQASVRLYDVATGQLIGEMTAPQIAGALNLVFDPSGGHLVIGTWEGRVLVVDLAQVVAGSSMAESLVFNQVVHTSPAPFPSLSADGILATAGFDAMVRLWNLHSGELLVEFRTDIADQVPPVAFSGDGRFLIYPDAGDVLRRFPMDPDALIELAESRVTRDLTADECRRYLDPATCPDS